MRTSCEQGVLTAEKCTLVEFAVVALDSDGSCTLGSGLALDISTFCTLECDSFTARRLNAVLQLFIGDIAVEGVLESDVFSAEIRCFCVECHSTAPACRLAL